MYLKTLVKHTFVCMYVCTVGDVITSVIVIVMHNELRMHDFFVAEQWQGDWKQKPMRYWQRGMVRVLLITVQIIQKLIYCIVIRCVIMNCKYKMVTIV